MPLSLFEGALGGIGLFLLGMRIMSDGIRTVLMTVSEVCLPQLRPIVCIHCCLACRCRCRSIPQVRR